MRENWHTQVYIHHVKNLSLIGLWLVYFRCGSQLVDKFMIFKANSSVNYLKSVISNSHITLGNLYWMNERLYGRLR